MKKHPFLAIDFNSSVKLTKEEEEKLLLWLSWSSHVMEKLVKREKIIKAISGLKTIRVSVMICGDREIQRLNNEHRQKDKVTDVLSFPSFETLRKANSQVSLFNGELFIGDLAICHPQTKRQAKEFGISYFDEFIHLFFHGLIHLMGYDHEFSRKEEVLMESWEKRALDSFSRKKKKEGY